MVDEIEDISVLKRHFAEVEVKFHPFQKLSLNGGSFFSFTLRPLYVSGKDSFVFMNRRI
jgi:hypothetical protein